MVVDSVGQEFRQRAREWFVSTPQCLGPPLWRPEGWGDLIAGGWSHLEASLLACLVVGWSWLLAGTWAVLSPGIPTCVLPMWAFLGFLTAWLLGSKSKCPKRAWWKWMTLYDLATQGHLHKSVDRGRMVEQISWPWLSLDDYQISDWS